MTLVNVVLVDQTHEIDPSLLHSASLALNSQAVQDLPKYWAGITANVSYAPSLASVPHGAWPVFLVRQLPPGEGGFHTDKNNQPYAKVIASAADDTWTIDASHEICEMLVDPYGNRLQPSQAMQIQGNGVVDAPGTYSYLVEACDPCEANNYAYEIGGIAVSDFITPHYYDASVASGVQYSFRGNVTRPREMLEGGYISYIKPDNSVEQILWVDPGPPTYNEIPGGLGGSLREAVHAAMGSRLDAAKHLSRRNAATLPAALAQRVAQHSERLAQHANRALVMSAHYGLRDE
jgi:hypothetical protein